MKVIPFLRDGMRRAPTGLYSVNYGNPIASGIIGAIGVAPLYGNTAQQYFASPVYNVLKPSELVTTLGSYSCRYTRPVAKASLYGPIPALHLLYSDFPTFPLAQSTTPSGTILVVGDSSLMTATNSVVAALHDTVGFFCATVRLSATGPLLTGRVRYASTYYEIGTASPATWGPTVVAAYAFNSGSQKLYINGALDGSETRTGAFPNAPTHIVLGWGATMAIFWNRILTDTELISVTTNPFQLVTGNQLYSIAALIAAGGETYYQTNNGALGLSAIQPGRWIYTTKGGIVVATAATPSKGVYATQEGSLVATGGVPKTVFGTQGGSLECTGAPAKMAQKSVAGTVSTSGNISRLVNKALSGNVAAAATIAKLISHALSANQALDGDLGYVATGLTLQSLTASLAVSGTVGKTVYRALSGTQSLSAALASTALGTTLQDVLGEIALSGVLGKKVSRALSGNVTPVGQIVKLLQQSLTGEVATGAALTASKVVGVSADASAIAAAIFAYPVEGTITFKEAIRLILAACAGDITYSAGTSQVIAAGGTKARITADVANTTRDVSALDVSD